MRSDRWFPALAVLLTAVVASGCDRAPSTPPAAKASPADWPVYGGNTEHTHYTTLDQISPANVTTLKVAWTYETGDAFPGSEMQANPIVRDGVLYATTPKMQGLRARCGNWSRTLAFRSEQRCRTHIADPAPRRGRHRRLA